MARVSNLASQYSVYDTLMRGRRARRAQRRFFEKLPTPPVQGETISTDDSGVGISGSDVGPIKFQDLTGVTGTSPLPREVLLWNLMALSSLPQIPL